MNATQSVWLGKFGAAFAVTLAVCCIVPRIFDNIPTFPLINSDREHVRIGLSSRRRAGASDPIDVRP